MDSMRSLNVSLPSSTSSRPAPPEQLLAAFRSAALSVTNLYKSAVTDQNVSRLAGYQEALEDLLSFLDRENLGLQDGEGWRVRQWATERYDGSAPQQTNDSEDERSEPIQRPHSTSPPREQPTEHIPSRPEPAKVESATQTDDTTTSTSHSHSTATPTPTPVYQFTGASTANVADAADDMQTDEEERKAGHVEEPSSTTSDAPIRVEVVNNRGSRTPHRRLHQRHGTRPANRELTFTTGTKRKIQFPDFFDISSIGSQDGFGNNKRGRIS